MIDSSNIAALIRTFEDINNMIELTKEDVLIILKALARIEGFLFGVDESESIYSELDFPVDLLTKKLMENDNA